MRAMIFAGVIAAALPSSAFAEEPRHFVNLDSTKLVWAIDIPGRGTCVAAAMMLAVSLHRTLDEVTPVVDGDLDYEGGCIAILK
jgi:hypothetical protein